MCLCAHVPFFASICRADRLTERRRQPLRVDLSACCRGFVPCFTGHVIPNGCWSLSDENRLCEKRPGAQSEASAHPWTTVLYCTVLIYCDVPVRLRIGREEKLGYRYTRLLLFLFSRGKSRFKMGRVQYVYHLIMHAVQKDMQVQGGQGKK